MFPLCILRIPRTTEIDSIRQVQSFSVPSLFPAVFLVCTFRISSFTYIYSTRHAHRFSYSHSCSYLVLVCTFRISSLTEFDSTKEKQCASHFQLQNIRLYLTYTILFAFPASQSPILLNKYNNLLISNITRSDCNRQIQ